MSAEEGAAEDYGSLVAALAKRKSKLSKRLRQVAQYFLNNPEDVAIYTIVELARQAGTHPSTISRFVKEMGFEGFGALQNVFRQRLVGPKMTYSDRMRALSEGPGKPTAANLQLDDAHVVFDTFLLAAMDALLRLRDDVEPAVLRGFVETLRGPGAVHIAAARGAYGVGAYSYYGFSRIGKRSHLIDNLGAMREQQLAAMAPDDVLFVLTFDDYTPETIELAKAAHRKGRTILVITDNELSPVADLGAYTLFVKEARLGHFRSQVPAMVLCQSIIVSLGSRIDR